MRKPIITEPQKGHIEIRCTCGKPITRSSARYGLDCDDRCNEKRVIARTKELGGIDPVTKMISVALGPAMAAEHERFCEQFK